jgi:hypothetical protein
MIGVGSRAFPLDSRSLYSQRSAVMGSIDDALQDGTMQASAATARIAKETPRISIGSCAPFTTQREINRFSLKLSARPASNPEPTLKPIEAGTIRSTSLFRAPSAMWSGRQS